MVVFQQDHYIPFGKTEAIQILVNLFQKRKGEGRGAAERTE
jgi:sulfur relay (sulfurtransferase) DsrC/TusE family protein